MSLDDGIVCRPPDKLLRSVPQRSELIGNVAASRCVGPLGPGPTRGQTTVAI